MQYILAGLIRFVMSGPLALFAGAAAVLALGYFLQIAENDRELRKAAALAAGPPAVVDIEDYDRASHRTDMGEVNLRAQLDFSMDYQLTLEGSTSTDRALMVPLLEVETGEPVGIALFTTRNFQFEDMEPMALLAKSQGFGEVGPILNLNGETGTLGKWDDIVADSFREQGRAFASDFLIVYPYVNGRAAEFAPKTGTVFGLFSKIAGAIALLAILKMVFRKPAPVSAEIPDLPPLQPSAGPQTASGFSPLDDPFALTGSNRKGMMQDDQADPLAVTPAPVVAAQVTENTPEWKRRLDAKINGQAADDTGSATLRAGMVGANTPAKRSFGATLRKVALIVVGAVFGLVLIATIGSLLMDARQNDAAAAVSIPTAEERVAQVVAEYVAPTTAATEKEWYEIDFAPIAQWFVAKGVLAVSGDKNAQVTLAMMVGGLFLLLFLLRWFFFVRGMFRPKIQPSMTGMGMDSGY